MLREVQHNMFSRTSLDKLLKNRLQQCIERRKDGGHPQSAWTAASIVLVGNLIYRLHQGLTESLTSVQHQRMATTYEYLVCILHKTTDRSNISLNDIVVFLEHNIWTKPGSKKDSTE